MNRITLILILSISLGLPAVSAGEGQIDGSGDNNRLPVTRVTLYTAGLAWMVHETSVTGNEIINFSVDQGDINDILKSLVIEDLNDGTVDSINFDSDNPLAVALSDLRVNPSGSPDLVNFLDRTQGEQVSITTPYGQFEGRIFSVEVLTVENKRKVLLNLMDFDGIKSIDISALQKLEFQDEILQNELLSALKLIAQSRVKSTRTLKLSFKGTGTRNIRLSYIRAVPLWKTSYRLVMDNEGIPRLEGWALVQNTGNLQWNNVQLSFVAGQPNAFTMDLATPRYIYREELQTATAAPLGAMEYDRGYSPQTESKADMSYKSAQPSMMFADSESYDEDIFYEMEESYSPAPVESQASGVRSGNFYRYEVKELVTINSRSSAMIPIIQQANAGSAIGVYDPSYNLVFKGLRLFNNSEAHWASGPATISEGRFYGGDALIPEMIPDSKRLITYAVHGTLEVEKILKTEPQEIVSLKIVDGLLHRIDKIRKETEYLIDGSEKELIIIHPKSSGWTLKENPEIDEETSGEYRFKLTNWDKPVVVAEEYQVFQQFSLSNFRKSDIAYYLEWREISDSLKNAFEKMSILLKEIDQIRSNISLNNSQISRLERDQNRVRENMRVLQSSSDLYKQYANQLSNQETDIQNLNKQIYDRQNELETLNESLKDFIRDLDIS